MVLNIQHKHILSRMWIIILILTNILIGCNCNIITQILMESKNTFNILPSNDCGKQLQSYIDGIKLRKLWALRMLDASAKLQSGYLEGNFYDLGNFDECLSVDEKNGTYSVQGKYCLASVSLSGLEQLDDMINKLGELVMGIQPSHGADKFHAQLGICLPAACSASDINEMLTKLSIKRITFDELYCQTKSTGTEFTTGDIITIYIGSIFAVIITVSTLYDTYLYYTGTSEKSQLLTSFSLLTNGLKLFNINKSSTQLSCLAGIRTITLMWIILGHSYIMINFTPYTNYLELPKWINQTSSMAIISAPLSVDTFFLLSGALLVYVFLHSFKNFSIKQVPLLYLHRYLRIVPALLAILVVHITVIKHFGSGPLWPFSAPMTGFCEKEWWLVLLFIRNFGTHVQCMPVTWYLTCDMQLFLLSPLLLIPLQKHPKLVIKMVVGLIVASIVNSFWTTWYYELSPFVIDDTFYTSPLRRVGSWLIGIILGYYIHHYKTTEEKIKLNKFLVILLWITSLMVMFICVFAGNHLVLESQLYKLDTIIHMGLVSPAWSLAVAWIIFACVFGYGGAINSFLSLPIFQILSKLGYSIYLLHASVLLVINMSSRSAIAESNAREMFIFWSNYMVIVVLSIVWTLSFESPVIALEKYILSDHKLDKTSDLDTAQKKNDIKII